MSIVPGHRDAQAEQRVPARVLAEIGNLHRHATTSTPGPVKQWWFEDLETGTVTEVTYTPNGERRRTYQHGEG